MATGTAVGTKTGGGVATTFPAKGIGLDGNGRRTGGNGHRPPPPPGGDGNGRPRESAHHYRIGMWVALASILMLFMALTSAYVFRAGTTGWQPLMIPRMLWASTALILASSFTVELARRSLRRNARAMYRRWLLVSAGLGLAFLFSQFLAWRELVSEGVYLASNPHSSFFYVLTALHGLHLAGGILGLCYLLWRTVRRSPTVSEVKRRAAADAVGTYWHFMDGLWLYLFGLLFLWR